MVGEGACSISEWRHLRDLRLVALWMKGYARRHRATYDVGKILAQWIAKPYFKVKDDFPYTMPWEQPKVIDGHAGMTAEQQDAELQNLIESFKKNHK